MLPRPEAVRYVAGWLTAGALVAFLALRLLHGGPSGTPSLPVVRAVALEDAVRAAHCRLMGPPRPARPAPTGVPRPGVFTRPLPGGSVPAAAAAGLIVIEYRHDVDDTFVGQLQAVQRGLPAATFLAPAGGRPRDAVSTVAGRRRLGCPRWGPRTLDAVRLFRGRYVGRRTRR